MKNNSLEKQKFISFLVEQDMDDQLIMMVFHWRDSTSVKGNSGWDGFVRSRKDLRDYYTKYMLTVKGINLTKPSKTVKRVV